MWYAAKITTEDLFSWKSERERAGVEQRDKASKKPRFRLNFVWCPNRSEDYVALNSLFLVVFWFGLEWNAFTCIPKLCCWANGLCGLKIVKGWDLICVHLHTHTQPTHTIWHLTGFSHLSLIVMCLPRTIHGQHFDWQTHCIIRFRFSCYTSLSLARSLVFGPSHFVLCFIFDFIILTQLDSSILSKFQFRFRWVIAFKSHFMLVAVFTFLFIPSKFSNYKHTSEWCEWHSYARRKKLIFSHSTVSTPYKT